MRPQWQSCRRCASGVGGWRGGEAVCVGVEGGLWPSRLMWCDAGQQTAMCPCMHPIGSPFNHALNLSIVQCGGAAGIRCGRGGFRVFAGNHAGHGPLQAPGACMGMPRAMGQGCLHAWGCMRRGIGMHGFAWGRGVCTHDCAWGRLSACSLPPIPG
jgi:hypothetical protein